MDVPTGNTGTDDLIDFPGDIIRLHEKHGCKYIARYAIWKEPLAVRNRTMAKNLAHKTIVEDSPAARLPAPIICWCFAARARTTCRSRIRSGFSYAGERKMPADLLRYEDWNGNQIENRYSHWIWRQYATAFWDDIRIGRVLPFQKSRDEEDEKHVHPLQLDVIDARSVLWSNPARRPHAVHGRRLRGLRGRCANRRGSAWNSSRVISGRR